jgi:tetratricopeptide (TPR) repeat protein
MLKNSLLPKGKASVISNEEQDRILLASFPYTRLDSLKAQFTLTSMLGSYPFVSNSPGISMQDFKPKEFVAQMSLNKNIDSVRGVVAHYYFRQKNYKAFSREINALIYHGTFDEHNFENTILLLANSELIKEAYPFIRAELDVEKKSPSVYKMIGFLNQTNGDMQDAIENYNKAIDLRPDNALLYFNRAVSYHSLDNTAAAIKDYDRSIQLNPDLVDAYYNRGILKYDAGDFEGTISDFSKVVEIDPKNAQAFVIRGHANMERGNKKAGCKDWLNASKLGSNEARPAYNKKCR